MLKKAGTLRKAVVLLAFVLAVIGNTVTRAADIRLTPFTGTDFVRIVVDARFEQAPGNSFNAIIRSLKDQSVLWQGPCS